MADTTRPIRITKKRASALLDLLAEGFASERASIEEAYGVKFEADGTLVLADGEFELLDSDQKDSLLARLEQLADANEAAEIFYRRYAAPKR